MVIEKYGHVPGVDRRFWIQSQNVNSAFWKTSICVSESKGRLQNIVFVNFMRNIDNSSLWILTDNCAFDGAQIIVLCTKVGGKSNYCQLS